MSRTAMFRMFVDIVMTLLLLLLMAFQATGRVVHEWLGVSLYVFFFVHQVLNAHWYKRKGRGPRTVWHRLNSMILLLLLLLMLLILTSGIMISREVFSFLDLRMAAVGRPLHKISTSWAFLLISVHIGMHWQMVMGMLMGRLRDTRVRVSINWAARAMGMFLAVFGVGVFIHRRAWEKFSLSVMYSFFDFEMPFSLVLLENAALMGLYAWISYYFFLFMRRSKLSRKINS